MVLTTGHTPVVSDSLVTVYLNTWSPADGAVWRGGEPCWRKHITGEGFEVTQPPPSSHLLGLLCTRV